MAIPTWPASLPSVALRKGFSIAPPNNLIVSNGDTGAGKVRKKGATPPITFTDILMVTDDQMDTFDTFYSSTLEDGSLRFEHIHPINGSSVELRIVAMSSEYAYKWVADGKGWSTTIKYIILP